MLMLRESLATTTSSANDDRHAPPAVAVLLCTFNGGNYLQEQLDSISRQKDARVSIHVSDDGSRDATRVVLDEFHERWREGELRVSQGPRRGHVANFFSLICAPIDADYYAYADQDDIWDSDKLSRAIDGLAEVPADLPAIYCSRTRLISEGGAVIGLSPLFKRPPQFANALIHNVGGGNTMVMNKAAMQLLRTVGPVDVVTHDWWTYMLITGAGGEVIYDSEPSLLYRQHDDNLIGSDMSLLARVTRFRKALGGRNREWNRKNVGALQKARHLLTRENRQILDAFCQARDARLVPRILGMWRSGVYAQSGLGNLAMYTAIFLKKL
ncbi:MAG: glycosyltransferase family 2 protein [Pseudomonadota bacterium]